MSENATQQQLIARFDHLLSLVEPISGQLDNLEKQVNERLDRLEQQQAELSARLDNLERQQTELSARLDNLERQQTALSAKLDGLETRVDQRLRETRPIWENVLSQLALLDKKIDTRADELRTETASGFRGVDRKIGVLSKNLVDMTADIQELRDVVEKLESQPA